MRLTSHSRGNTTAALANGAAILAVGQGRSGVPLIPVLGP